MSLKPRTGPGQDLALQAVKLFNIFKTSSVAKRVFVQLGAFSVLVLLPTGFLAREYYTHFFLYQKAQHEGDDLLRARGEKPNSKLW